MAGKMVVLDTCIVIELQKGNPAVIQSVYDFKQQDIFLTPIVIAEFLRGTRDRLEFLKCRKLIDKFGMLSLNKEVSDIFLQIFEEFSLSHRPSVPDMLIAAASIYHNIPLLTLNKKDFHFIPSLQLL